MNEYEHLATPRMTVLGRLTDAGTAFRDNPPEEPVLYHSGDDFQDLFSLQALDNVLSSGGRRRPDFRVIRDGVQVPDSRFTRASRMYSDLPDTRKIGRELAGGATLVLQGLHGYHEPLGRFSRCLAHDLSRPVHVNAYMTPQKSQGFGSHYDPTDAFIVQIEGSKDWTLREPPLRRPLAHETWDSFRQRAGADVGRLDESPPWREVTLRPGDCLWLPRGWVHSARSSQVTSLHLTLSVTPWTEHWAVLELLHRLAEAPGRSELPAAFVWDNDRAIATVARLRAELAHWLDHVPDTELAAHLRSAAIGWFAEPQRQVSALVADDAITPEAEFSVHSETVFAAVERGDRLELHLASRILTLSADAAAVCADILGRERFTVAELSGEQNPAARAQVVRAMWGEGIVERRSA